MSDEDNFLKQMVHKLNIDAHTNINKNITDSNLKKAHIEKDIFKQPPKPTLPPRLSVPPGIQKIVHSQNTSHTPVPNSIPNFDPNLVQELITAFNKMSRQFEALQKKQMHSRVLKTLEKKIQEESGEITIKIKFDKDENNNS